MADSERERLARIRPNLERRAQIYEITRRFFSRQGFLEVNTPIRVPTVAPELYITPFSSEDWFLSTSPELHMKRLLAAGYQKLFQITPCFRKGERGRQHNPEFAMIEWYRAGGGYMDMVADTQDLVWGIAGVLGAGHKLSYQGQRVNLEPPWSRLTVREVFVKFAGWDPVNQPDPLRFDLDLVGKVIPSLPPDSPVVLADYPAHMASLARLKPGQRDVAERAEVFIAGLEIANAYSELTDPEEQSRRFCDEAEFIRHEKGIECPLPERFLDAVRNLPECGGIALGMDRLVMLFCDVVSIDDVVPFTSDTA